MSGRQTKWSLVPWTANSTAIFAMGGILSEKHRKSMVLPLAGTGSFDGNCVGTTSHMERCRLCRLHGPMIAVEP